jgi:hypothetical protein
MAQLDGDDLETIFRPEGLTNGRKQHVLNELNDETPCPCKCGHILPEDRRPIGMFAMVMPGGNPGEYYMFIHKPGGLCYECYHAGCERPPPRWILVGGQSVINPKYPKN